MQDLTSTRSPGHTEKHNVTTSCAITRVVFVLVFLFPCLAPAFADNKKPAEAG
jgi:hypothetical protein